MICKYFSPNLRGCNSLNLGCVVPSPGIPEAEPLILVHLFPQLPQVQLTSLNQSFLPRWGWLTPAPVCPHRDILRVGVTLAGHQKKILNSVQMMRAQMNQIQSVEV